MASASASAGPARKKIVVAGGSGFLGSRICRSAVGRGWNVTSISRSGEPSWQLVTASATAPAWSKQVQWAQGDILQPPTYTALLKDAHAVVHTMGILLEADYKGLLSGKESPLSAFQRAFSASPKPGSGARNPLDRQSDQGQDQDLGNGQKAGQITYELMNRDSAITLASAAQDAGVACFIYISAAAGAPLLPARYITTKRAAESAIANNLTQLRSIFFRPGFMYDSSRKVTLPIAASGVVGSTVNELVGGKLSSLFGAAVEKPLKADVVADAVVEAIAADETKGVVDTQAIEALAAKAWRRTML
ncbi:hypothetical protein DV736_g3281, partial [Chaetothyriales sp. CBS 134916]